MADVTLIRPEQEQIQSALLAAAWRVLALAHYFAGPRGDVGVDKW